MTQAPWVSIPVPPGPGFWRRAAAAALRRASVALARWSRQVQRRQRPGCPVQPPVLEFHAEAGAPEGALYVDGVLFGRIDGVQRL